MAFGITKYELVNWKDEVKRGEIAFLTHYWYDERFPEYSTVTKVGCSSITKLIEWGKQYNLSAEWIHDGKYPHYDLMGHKQYHILKSEGILSHIKRFNLITPAQ